MLMVNTLDRPVRTDEFGGVELLPGGTHEFLDGYCRPGLYANGSRRPSIVEMVLPGVVPADESVREEWSKPPVPRPKALPTPTQVAAQLQAEGLPPAAADLVAGGIAESRRKRKAAE